MGRKPSPITDKAAAGHARPRRAMGAGAQKWGVAVYWLAWPALWLYLKFGRRTRILVVCDRQVLLVKGWLGDGKWSLPGGGLHRHEAPRRGAQRELHEETALDIAGADFRPIASLTGNNHGLTFKYDLFVVEVTAVRPVQRQPREIVAIGWYDYRQLPAEQVTDDTRAALGRWFTD